MICPPTTKIPLTVTGEASPELSIPWLGVGYAGSQLTTGEETDAVGAEATTAVVEADVLPAAQ